MNRAERALVGDLVAYVEHVQHRVCQDALAEASAAYWRRRAESFRWARPDPAVDYAGQATLEQLRIRWVELTNLADACDARAEVSLIRTDDVAPGDDAVLVELAITEVRGREAA